MRAEQGTRNDVPLDFRCAFPDALDTCVAPDALERQVIHQAHAAMDLDGLVGDKGKHFGGLELGHRHVLIRDGSLVEFPASLEGEQVGGFQLRGHIRQLERNTLELADLLAELLALCRILNGMSERPFGAAEAGCRDLEAGCPEPGIGNFEALVNFAEDLHPGAGGSRRTR